MQSQTPPDNAEQLIQQTGQLFSLPDVCMRVNQMVADAHSSADEIAAVLAQDTALTAHLLRIVNSAYYGLPGRVETISRAITIVGTQELRNLAILSFACELFQGIDPELSDMERFWRHSLTTGVVARSLADRCNVLHPERLFVMGVLHNIGRLVIYQQLPDHARQILQAEAGGEADDVEVETRVLGFDHTELGSALVSYWQLPASIAQAIRWHHTPGMADELPLESAILHIAALVAERMLWDAGEVPEGLPVASVAWQVTGLDLAICRQVEGEVGGEIRELFAILMGRN